MPIKPRHLTISKAIELRRKNPTKNRRTVNEVLKETRKKRYESWNYCDGGAHRYREIYKENLNNRPLNFLLEKLKIKDPQLMVLGPGHGYDNALFKKELHEFRVNIHIDTLGFSKTINQKLLEDKVIRKDYSPRISKAISFEHINPIEHPRLVKSILGKYHLVMGERSVGVYGASHAYALFQSSLLLAKRGRAYIDLQFNSPLKEILDVTRRMINSYNKTNNTNLKFLIKEIKETSGTNSKGNYTYIQIDRIE